MSVDSILVSLTPICPFEEDVSFSEPDLQGNHLISRQRQTGCVAVTLIQRPNPLDKLCHRSTYLDLATRNLAFLELTEKRADELKVGIWFLLVDACKIRDQSSSDYY